MKTSNFRIVPLPTEVANAARQATTAGVPDHAVITARPDDVGVDRRRRDREQRRVELRGSVVHDAVAL